MSQPTVCAVMLTADRPEYARRAVEAFRTQNYAWKKLMALDSALHNAPGMPWGSGDATTVWMPDMADKNIGELRNAVNWCATDHFDADILIHWDDDDWSHPNRIAEQVALLQSSGADAVGYNQMLFWREDTIEPEEKPDGNWLGYSREDGEAWLYTGDILGTSLCYWRKTWETQPFAAISHGEDSDWLNRIRVKGMKIESCHPGGMPLGQLPEKETLSQFIEPRMIARIHAGNRTNPAYDPASMAAHPHHWMRVPQWDTHCRSVIE